MLRNQDPIGHSNGYIYSPHSFLPSFPSFLAFGKKKKVTLLSLQLPNPKPRSKSLISLSLLQALGGGRLMGMDSQDSGWQKENMENKGLYGNNNLGVFKSPFESIDRIDLSDRGILRQVNRNSAVCKERKSPNSGTDFGSFSYEDCSKNQGSEAHLKGLECRCDLGSNCKSGFSSNHSQSRTPRGVGSGFKLDTVTPEEMFGPVSNSKLEIGDRPLFHVMSEGNLNELDCELEFGSSFEKRFASPKPRTSLTPNTVSDLSRIKKRGRCVSELGFGSIRETQIQQSPNYGLHLSPYENARYKPKPPNAPRMDSFSQRRQCLCGTPKCHSLQEDFTGQYLSNKPERKDNIGNKKGSCGLSTICKGPIVLILLAILFLTVTINKSAFFGPNFGPSKLSIGVDPANLFLNLVDLRSNRSEDVNLERQIEPCRSDLKNNHGELEGQTGPHEVDLSSNSSEEEKIERQIVEPDIDEGKLEENTELLVSNGTELIEGANIMEEPDITEIPIEENSSKEKLQSKIEDEFKPENAKQCGASDIIEGELEGSPVTIPVKQTGYVALVQTDFEDRIEDRKLEMRIRFCVGFVSVLLCASLVSCIIRRDQFGEMMERYCSSNKAEKSSKKRAKNESSVLPGDCYGSIVAYEKIAITKRGGGGTDESLTPVRRSSRIRNYLASHS